MPSDHLSAEDLAAIRDRDWAQGIVRTMDYYVQAHRDRGTLLAEVDRLLARVAHLEAEVRYLTGETDE